MCTHVQKLGVILKPQLTESMSRLRNWCFTINNPTAEDRKNLEEMPCEYMVIGEEEGESKTQHIQGYVEFGKAKTFATLRRMIPRAHLEGRKGTPEEASKYCKKEEQYKERGTLSTERQGHRSDLDAVRLAAASDGMRAVVSMYNYGQIRTAEKYLTYCEGVRDWKPEVIWYWGPTASGKSRQAREDTEGEDVYVKNDGTKWWEGYDGHETVIIDDFRDSWWSLTEMLSLLDRYEKRIEFKGGSRQLLAKKIIVTSSKPPEDCYEHCESTASVQLCRRVETVIHME